MKMGTTASPWRYDAGAFNKLQLIILRMPAILRRFVERSHVMQSRHRVEEFIAAYNRKDIRGALACFTDDAVYQDVTYGTHSGPGELKKMLERMFLEADACWKVHTWVADAQRVAIEWTIDSQITDAVPQSAGKRVRLFAMGLFEFRDGRIASYREYLDFGQVLLQLGVSPEGLHRALSKKLARTLTATDEGAA
jgi:limonene-1,2-epoxide hydrolase